VVDYDLMPPDQAAASVLAANSLPDSGGDRQADIRADLADRYAWPALLTPIAAPLRDLSAVMDLGKLADVAKAINNANELSFAIVSKEYIQTGLNWIYAMFRLGLDNFFIIAGDGFTSETLDARGIPNVLAVIDESEFDGSFVSSTGFSAKGLAVSAFKFPVAHFLVESGYSVVLSDADAVWLRDPMPYLRSADVAFQRIVYHPPAIATQWGFAGCGGFLSFRHAGKTVSFLERCIQEHRLLFCDQVAFNLALLQGHPDWYCEDADWMLPVSDLQHSKGALEAAFIKYTEYAIKGHLRRDGLQLLALPHDKFWRHALVAHSLRDMVVCHPNSPKDDLEKMKLLTSMGLRFQAEPSIRPLTGERAAD
jgi:Nucleotide-diphospho-sugar transferase